MKLSALVIKAMIAFAAFGVMTSCISKKKYEEAMTRAAAEKSSLESALEASKEENEKLKADFASLEQNLSMSKEEIATLSETIKENNGQIGQLQNAIKEAFDFMESDDIQVEERNGKLYITMANKILFEAGRDRLTSGSKDIIATLAGVLNNNGDMDIAVEGHTDSDPVKIHRARYKDNWQLSVARSLNVVRELEKNGVDAGRLTAGGKGDTQPIAANDTDEGKDANRRTEFVVKPKVDGLYKMYKSGFDGASGMD